MGISDNFRVLIRKAWQIAREHPRETEQVPDKAEHIIDEKTGGKHSGQLNKGAERLNSGLASKDFRSNNSSLIPRGRAE